MPLPPLPPKLKLEPFQYDGVDALLKNVHYILGDEMGLGKTVQACTALYNAEMDGRINHKITWPDNVLEALVICPANQVVKKDWAAHLELWAGIEKDDIFIFWKGTDRIPPNAKAVIVNYELLDQIEVFRDIRKKWYRAVIVDEVHRVKNPKSKRTDKILKYKGDGTNLISRGFYKWGLSGTWLPNSRPIEAYAWLRTTAPELLGDHKDYYDYGEYFCNGYVDDDFGGWNFNGASHVEEFAAILAQCFLKRKASDVYKQVPGARIQNLYIDIGEMEHDETNTLRPTLYAEVGNKKLPYVIDYLKDRFQDHPYDNILCFTYHKDVSEGLFHAFSKDRPTSLIYGGSTKRQRENAFDLFTKCPTCRDDNLREQNSVLQTFRFCTGHLMLLQYKSGAESLNGLQHCCNNIVLAERDDSLEPQAIGRLCRMGQTQITNVAVLIAEGTLDDKIHGSNRGKARLGKRIMKSTTGTTSTREVEIVADQELARIAAAVETIASCLLSKEGWTSVQHEDKGGRTEVTLLKELKEEKQEVNKGGRGKKNVAANADDATVKSAETNGTKNGATSDKTKDNIRDICQKYLAASDNEVEARKGIQDIFAEVCSAKQFPDGIPVKALPDEKNNWVFQQLEELVAASDPHGLG